MISSLKKTAPTPLEAEYREMRKQSSHSGVPSIGAASQRVIRMNASTEDIVTLSSQATDKESSTIKPKPSQPVTPDERRALLYGFSVYG